MNGTFNLNKYLQTIYILDNFKTNESQKRLFWIEIYQSLSTITDFHINVGLTMALINPKFPDIRLDNRNGFVRTLASKCELHKIINGAKCPNTAMEKDHIWPHALGGITEDRNRADLCIACNRGKSYTVGYFPWSEKTPDWVIEKIERTRNLIGK